MRVSFGCGHGVDLPDNTVTAPTCPQCGAQTIARVQVRAPRFVGACRGPYAETKALEPAVVNVAPGGSLTLKAQKD